MLLCALSVISSAFSPLGLPHQLLQAGACCPGTLGVATVPLANQAHCECWVLCCHGPFPLPPPPLSFLLSLPSSSLHPPMLIPMSHSLLHYLSPPFSSSPPPPTPSSPVHPPPPPTPPTPSSPVLPPSLSPSSWSTAGGRLCCECSWPGAQWFCPKGGGDRE